MSELTTIEAKVAHLEGETKDAFHAALEKFKAEMIRLGIEHAVTPAAPVVVTDPEPVEVKTGGDAPAVGSGGQPQTGGK